MNLNENINRVRQIMGLQEQITTLSDAAKAMGLPNVQSAYSNIVNAVKGMGTNPDEVLNSIKMLKDKKEFFALQELLKDGQTGYNNFEDMINQEYERDNIEDVKNLAHALSKLGVYTTFQTSSNRLGERLFTGNFQFVYNWDVDSDCEKRYNEALPSAIKYWKDWLSNPTTKEKIKKNWGIKTTYTSTIMVADTRFDAIYKEYFSLLDNIKIVFYSHKDGYNPSAHAFVNPFSKNEIFVNCSFMSKNPKSTLIHEIQHLLWYVKPMNSEKSIADVFNSKDSSTSNDSEVQKKASQVEKSMGLEPYSLMSLYDAAIMQMGATNTSYICDENEKMSNIMSIRETLGVKPGEKITLQHIKPYLKGSFRDNIDISYLLYCWALKGFPDINQMLNRINDLALNQSQNQQDNSNVA